MDHRPDAVTCECRHMDALSDCLAALDTDPRYTRAYMKKADVLTAVGDYEGWDAHRETLLCFASPAKGHSNATCRQLLCGNSEEHRRLSWPVSSSISALSRV